MINDVQSKGVALATLSTASLVSLYQGNQQYKCSLPRDFLINTLLIREFGQSSVTAHIAEAADQYQHHISYLMEQLHSK